jgi:hypothetical protein
VTKTDRSGVLAAIQCDAVSCARLIAISVERRCQIPIRAGENADTIRTAAMIGRGQRLTSQAARIATAIHMIWKYLFMSNTTALTTTTLGTTNRATSQATRNPRAGSRRTVRAARTARTNGIPRFVR